MSRNLSNLRLRLIYLHLTRPNFFNIINVIRMWLMTGLCLLVRSFVWLIHPFIILPCSWFSRLPASQITDTDTEQPVSLSVLRGSAENWGRNFSLQNYLMLYIYGWAAIAQSVQRLPTDWTVRGSNSGGSEIFRTGPDRPWDPPSLL